MTRCSEGVDLQRFGNLDFVERLIFRLLQKAAGCGRGEWDYVAGT